MRKQRKPLKATEPARVFGAGPMAEGPVKKERRPHGFLTKMKDAGLLEYASNFLNDNRICGRKELANSDSGLYDALRERKLLEKTGLVKKRHDWASMSNEMLIEYSKEFIKAKGIGGRKELEKVNLRLYQILLKRKLLGKIGLGKKLRNWKSMNDEKLFECAKELLNGMGIRGRAELAKADNGLYKILRKRRLLEKVGIERKTHEERDWDSMGDEKLIAHAEEFMKEQGIFGRDELKKEDPGLYEILRQRSLLGKVGFKTEMFEKRDWKSMDNAKLVEHTHRFVREKGITGRNKLRKADSGLYTVLWDRHLLAHVFFKIEKTKQQSLESQLLSGLRQAPEAMEKFGEGK